MLRLYALSPQRIDYYLEVTKSESRTPFYEHDGYWLGQLSTEFGLTGAVRRSTLDPLFVGRHPTGGEELNRYQRRVRISAIDATFAAPKTISLLAALGTPAITQRIEEAHRSSVDESIKFIERNVVKIRRQIDGRRVTVRPNGVGVATFEHRTSRASDPHLHSHALILNVATPDGHTWSALDSRSLFAHAALLGALYRSSLRYHLGCSFNLAWREIKPGWFDLGGLSKTMVQAFSTRQTHILADAGTASFSSYRAREVASLRTRKVRELMISYGELREHWQATAYRSGISRSRLEELAQIRSAPTRGVLDHPLAAYREGPGGDRSITGLITKIAQGRNGPMPRAQLMRAIVDRLPEGVRVNDLEGFITQAVEGGLLPAPTPLWPDGPRGALSRQVELGLIRRREAMGATDYYSYDTGRLRPVRSAPELVYAR